MSGICAGRVVVITGAGRGLGREHALEFARQGAKLVINDRGVPLDGDDASLAPAEQVVEEIRAAGGEAIANGDDVSDWDGARRLVEAAVHTYGDLHVLVNNAGILRDRMFVNMSAEEWDAVIRVHLRGTFAPTRHAAAYWRNRAKEGSPVDARVVNTTSPTGLYGNIGQANYGAAKAAIASLTVILADELSRYGVTVNAVAPVALTRMTEGLPGFAEQAEQAVAQTGFNPFDPGNVSPLVAWLGSPDSAGVTGRVFNVYGGHLSVAEAWVTGPAFEQAGRFDAAKLGPVVADLVARARPNSDMRGHPRT